MIDIRSISDLISSLQGIKDLTQSIVVSRDSRVVESKTNELRAEVLLALDSALSSKTEQLTLVDEIRSLKEEVLQLRDWSADKARYELKEIAPGVTAYAIKEPMQDGEFKHHICVKCFQHNKKSILQKEIRSPGRARVLTCKECKSDFYISGIPKAEHRNYHI
ncbi:MAG: hypothetical protein AAF228_13255 [Pseudomonadota bacterium]